MSKPTVVGQATLYMTVAEFLDTIEDACAASGKPTISFSINLGRGDVRNFAITSLNYLDAIEAAKTGVKN